MTWTRQRVPAFAAGLIRAHHDGLVAVARGAYPRAGRGLLAVTFRGNAPTATPELREVKIGYRPLAQYQRLTAALTGQGRQMADDVIRRVETYDPLMEMVVVAVVGPQFFTVPFTVPLDPPTLLDDAVGVH